MDRYYTLMLIPETDKKVRSWRLPKIFLKSLSFFTVLSLILLAILAYDYKQVLNQVFENKHLVQENRSLREQLNIFQMKMNGLSSDIERIHILEKKLRIMTGVEQGRNQEGEDSNPETTYLQRSQKLTQPFKEEDVALNIELNNFQQAPTYIKIKELYDQKMMQDYFGADEGPEYVKEWLEYVQRGMTLGSEFAAFDYRYSLLKDVVQKLETDIHLVDQFLLDKESFLKSTPTILPAQGWITSYYGPRTSPYSGKLKMHEGLDIGARMGTNIMAPADGIVTFSGHKPGFGKFVQIDHGYGVESIFGHAQSLSVQRGQKINRGDMIAKVGNTGLSTGPHVHYEVRVNGTAVDPLYFILD